MVPADGLAGEEDLGLVADDVQAQVGAHVPPEGDVVLVRAGVNPST